MTWTFMAASRYALHRTGATAQLVSAGGACVRKTARLTSVHPNDLGIPWGRLRFSSSHAELLRITRCCTHVVTASRASVDGRKSQAVDGHCLVAANPRWVRRRADGVPHCSVNPILTCACRYHRASVPARFYWFNDTVWILPFVRRAAWR